MPNRPQYAKQMQQVIAGLTGRPSLLLHACCAPCSSGVLPQLEQHFHLTILYYNPNIDPPEEYRRREQELETFLQASRRMGIPLVELPYRPQEFYDAVRGLEDEPECGARCTVCYELRMRQAARYAAEHGFEWFASTLSVSPLKDPVRINEIGQRLAAEYGVKHLPSEFRKRDGYLHSLRESAKYGLYRQDYCGCVFSRRVRQSTAEIPEDPQP